MDEYLQDANLVGNITIILLGQGANSSFRIIFQEVLKCLNKHFIQNI